MISYLFETFIYQSILIGLYQLLKTESYFKINRFYLLLSLVVSHLIPLVDYGVVLPTVASQPYVEYLQPIRIGGALEKSIGGDNYSGILDSKTNNFNPFYAIYFVGLLIYLGWFIKQNKRLLRLLKLNKTYEYKAKPVVLLQNTSNAFSFWNRIYIGENIPKLQYPLILEHEYQHLNLKHSFDLVFLQTLTFILWFNPLLHLYRRFLVQVHEFEADDKVISQSSKPEYINTLLNQKFSSSSVSFVHMFFNSTQLKNRIKMIVQSKKARPLKYIFIVPVWTLCVLISCTQDEFEEIDINESNNKEKYSPFWEEYLEIFTYVNDSKPPVKERIKQKPSVKELLGSYGYAIQNVYYGKAKWRVSLIMSALSSSEEYKNDEEYRISLLNEIRDSRDLWGSVNILMKDYKENGGFISYNVKGETVLFDESYSLNTLDRSPHPKSCSGSNDKELKTCFNSFISEHVENHFDISKFKNFKPKKYRVSVQFKIDKTGNVIDIISNSYIKDFEIEAERAVSLLPQFIPGEHNGQKVEVLYSLPINFVID